MLRLCLGVSIALALTASARADYPCDGPSYTVKQWKGQQLLALLYARRDGHELVIWRDGEELMAKAVGAPGGGNPLPMPRMAPLTLAAAPDGFVLLAGYDGSVVVQRLDDDGKVRGPMVRVGAAGFILTQAAIVADDAGFVVAWSRGFYDAPQDLLVARLDADATLVAGPVVLRTLMRRAPPTVALATDGATTWLAWHDFVRPAVPKLDERSYAVRIAADATAANEPLLLGTGNVMALGQREGQFLAVLDADTSGLSMWSVEAVSFAGQATGPAHTVTLQRNFELGLVSDAAGFTLYSSVRDASSFPRLDGVGLVGLTPEGAPREAARWLSAGANAALGFDGQQLRVAFIADRATGTKGVSRIEVMPVSGGTPVVVGAESQLEQVEVEICGEELQHDGGCTVASGKRPSSEGLGALLVACGLLWVWRRRLRGGPGRKRRGAPHNQCCPRLGSNVTGTCPRLCQ
ncbi:MAG: hypothetical protein IT370_11185 [Deltaproteobacteria bacterium]|nr:hypothetical protein [Deltaproteobacteria bacterium]